MGFETIAGLYVLAGALALIIMYLIRPKSFEKTIPSLMFFMREKTKTTTSSFLQRWVRNLLFLLQLLILLALGFAAAEPFLNIPHSVIIKNSVIIIDTSASMTSKAGLSTRFDKAKDIAKDHLGFRNTIILAGKIPVVAAEAVSSSEAISIINKLRAKATSTNLGDAMLLAQDLLTGKAGVVTIISDFIITEGPDVLISKQSLVADGNTVVFKLVTSDASNVGIVGLEVQKGNTLVEIKNFGSQTKNVNVKVKQGTATLTQRQLTLFPRSQEGIQINTPSGISRITLDVNDDFAIDNTAYISNPLKKSIRVLLISNALSGNKIKAAFQSMADVELEIREPPTLNAYNIKHDLVIINDISPKLIVPTDFKDLRKYVEKGGVLIFSAQESMDSITNLLENEGIQDLLPIHAKAVNKKQTAVCVDIIGPLFPKDPYAKDPCFTSVTTYIQATEKNGSLTLATTLYDNSPVLATRPLGSGEVFYYGLIDRLTSFYSDPFYPLFWRNVMSFLLKTDDIQTFNQPAGKLLAIKQQQVTTPSQEFTTNKLLLDEAGIYKFDNKPIAVNLLDESESDINQESLAVEDTLQRQDDTKIVQLEKFRLAVPLLTLALILLIIESIYIKFRGDL